MQEFDKESQRTVVGLIPARYQSTRFPGKPLAEIDGVPMIKRVYEQCKKSKYLSHSYVVTDDERIMRYCMDEDINCSMVRDETRTGTDRIGLAFRRNFSGPQQPDFFVNIQGDEPVINPKSIDMLIDAYDNRYGVVNAYTKIRDKKELTDMNVVKALVGRDNLARHYSRHPISDYKQLGLYMFNRGMLECFLNLKPSKYEIRENVEMIRYLDNGFKIKCVEVYDSISVDTPEDIKIAEEFLRNES